MHVRGCIQGGVHTRWQEPFLCIKVRKKVYDTLYLLIHYIFTHNISVEPETRRGLHAVRPDRTVSERPIPEHVVNVRTSPVRNLVPADLKTDGIGFGLPIALGLLLGSGQPAIRLARQLRHRRRAGTHR